MKLVKIDKSKFSAVGGNSVYEYEHAVDEYVTCVYNDKGTSQEMFIPAGVTRTLTPNGYRAITKIDTGCIIYSVIIVVQQHASVDTV